MAHGAFAEWWLRQVATAFARRPEAVPPDALIVDVEEFSVAPSRLRGRILIRRGGCERFAGSLEQRVGSAAEMAAPQTVILRLPAALTLQRRLTLPAMAAGDLQGVIGFELDRLTPFAKDEVLWGSFGQMRGPRNWQLTLFIVPKSVLHPLSAALGRIGFVATSVESGRGCIRLDQRRRKPAGLAKFAPLGICGAMLLGIVSIPVIQQQRRLIEIDRQLEILAPARQALGSLRRQYAMLNAARSMAAAALNGGDQLPILAALTGVLPNGTWLTSLNLAPRAITFSGQSANAAQLITLLAASPLFQNPSFIGPVIRAGDGGGQLFSIKAGIAQ